VALVEFFNDPEIDFFGTEENTLSATQKRKLIEA
jgi:hypothetical protein